MSNPFSNHVLFGPASFRPEWDVQSLHDEAAQQLIDSALRIRDGNGAVAERKIHALLSYPGHGKTHLFGRLARRLAGDVFFVFVPQIEEILRPLEHVRWHLVEALFNRRRDEHTALEVMLAKRCQASFVSRFDALPPPVAADHHQVGQRLRDDPLTVLRIVDDVKSLRAFHHLAASIADRHPHQRHDVMRVLALGWSPEKELARRWLRGESLSDRDLERLRIRAEHERPAPMEVIRAVSRLLPCDTPMVVCLDQLEAVLENADALNELSNGLMKLLHDIPNALITLTSHQDNWFKNLGTWTALRDRTNEIHLERPTVDQLLELVSLRLKHWEKLPAEKGRLWPFDEQNLVEVIGKYEPGARQLLRQCDEAFQSWEAEGDIEQAIYVGDKPSLPLEELFREEWEKTLAQVQKERSPADVQEERLHRALGEMIELIFQVSDSSLFGSHLSSVEKSVIGVNSPWAEYSRRLILTANDCLERVLVAFVKTESAGRFTTYLKGLKSCLADKNSRCVLLHHQRDLPLGKQSSAIGTTIYRELRNANKVEPFPLVDELETFHWLETFLVLRDRAANGDLVLGNKTIELADVQQLTVKEMGFLENLKLLRMIFQAPDQAPQGKPSQKQLAEKAMADVLPSPPPIQQPTAIAAGAAAATVARPAKPAAPPAVAAQTAVVVAEPRAAATPEIAAVAWARDLLQEVTEELRNFRCELEGRDVEVGARFARLMVRTTGHTTVGHIKRQAEDLKTRITDIVATPVIDSQAHGVSIDVQLPPRHCRVVTLDDMNRQAPGSDGSLAFPVGQDVSGCAHWADFGDPDTAHFLVAGTTGSGKSEFLKAMIAGMAQRHDPTALKFILIDPKRITFNFGDDSPYFDNPPVFSAEEAMPLLNWCFEETERRYEKLQRLKLNDHAQWQRESNDAPPRYVVICDEFPDLIADKDVKKDLEQPLFRISAKARAAGIHLVLAAQRPEAKVVTPQLRSCLPGRVCLRVSSAADSKIVLDQPDAADLLGKGDLFWKTGPSLLRLQSPLVSQEELEKALRL